MFRNACHFFALLIIHCLLASPAGSQCIAVSPTTPYYENFESSAGSWTAGGTMSDWTWGHPAKATITGAGSGQKCWITGNLAGSDYNAGQRSYIVSPCYDFTNLSAPWVQFKVFWETETRYDGACFQYSLNNGVSWLNVGAYSEAANCLNNNWFNTASISNMTGLGPSKEGWSGTLKPASGSCGGGNGSGSWVIASHAMTGLAGKAGVQFRFTFGAGTTCNSYDGFAVDDILIANAPPDTVNFTPVCIASNKLAFNNSSSPCFSSFSWDFGDPASGSANVVSAFNTTHTFSAPGKYTIVLTGTGGAGPAFSVAKDIYVMDVNAVITKPVSCHNLNNAILTAVVNADNGIVNIAYSWNTVPVATTPIVSGISPGNYIVTVTADNACTARDTLTVVNPALLTHAPTKISPTCGRTNGAVTINESGGYMPYSYTWFPNVAAGSAAASLPAGSYVISISDSLGCADSVHADIVNMGGISVAITNKTDVKCREGNTGSATATAASTFTPITYQWLPTGGNGATSTNLVAGIYKVKVTDGAGCQDSATVQITQPASGITAGTTVSHTSCGKTNGTATVHAAGGVGAYTYYWTPGGSATDSISNLTGGTYTVLVTDNSGCSITRQATVNPSDEPRITGVSIHSALCYGQQNGGATALVGGGVPPYTYTWTNGFTVYSTNPLQNVGSGAYQLSVKDSKGCSSQVRLVNIIQPMPLAHAVSVVNIACANATGSATITETGGTAPYSYSWSPSGGSAATATGLAIGSYVVSVTDNAGCTDTIHLQIKNTSTLAVTIDKITNITCFGGSDGSININVTAQPPYSISWAPYGGNSNVATALAAGSYTATITDASGCTASVSAMVTEPIAITGIITTKPSICGLSNGGAGVMATGGSSPYSFSWLPGSLTGNLVSNLAAGAYIVSITDGKGCMQTVYFIIDGVPLPHISLGNDTAVCPREQVLLSPGKFARYRWQDGSADSIYIATRSGIYSVTVTDSIGCTVADTIKISNECQDILFPDAFTPNGDNRNDLFGPSGTLSAVSAYSLRIFNRWGQQIFATTRPSKKWDGKTNGAEAGTGVYIWMAEYSFNHKATKMMKGTLVLIK